MSGTEEPVWRVMVPVELSIQAPNYEVAIAIATIVLAYHNFKSVSALSWAIASPAEPDTELGLLFRRI